MLNHIIQILDYIVDSFIHIWPYLLVTIPIAVAVKMSGASKYIERALTARPVVAILLATLVGAFSPLCSCSVVPVIAALLIGGVPLAPVMSFWLASPSMDPEIFFLTVSTLGWELAAWRMGATLIMSLGGGFITHYLVQRKMLGEKFLRENRSTQIRTIGSMIKQLWITIISKMRASLNPNRAPSMALDVGIYSAQAQPAASDVSYSGGGFHKNQIAKVSITKPNAAKSCGCGDGAGQIIETHDLMPIEESNCGCGSFEESAQKEEIIQNPTSDFWKRLMKETWSATSMVIKFMLLAWFVGALIRLYVPETWITSTLGGGNSWAIITAALLGIPIYTSNMTAMPLVGGLLAQGMHPGAALAFLIAGPTTTLPAMSAVWGLVNRKVFGIYIGFSLIGAIFLGYLYTFTL